MGDFKYSLRTRIAVTSILMPAILVTVFLYIFFRHCKWQIVDSSVANARTICLCADSVYDEIESRWEMGLFTQELLQKWHNQGEVDKMRASSPLLTAWKTAANNGYKFKVIERHQGDQSNILD
ncbi:MAG: hypothetical protein KAR47_15670, partial [Planctomycetes bacterium]|nr:hypothetical protein [Planctomycetota bacterium]